MARIEAIGELISLRSLRPSLGWRRGHGELADVVQKASERDDLQFAF